MFRNEFSITICRNLEFSDIGELDRRRIEDDLERIDREDLSNLLETDFKDVRDLFVRVLRCSRSRINSKDETFEKVSSSINSSFLMFVIKAR